METTQRFEIEVLLCEGQVRFSQKVLMDQSVVHLDSEAEGWTAANSLPVVNNFKDLLFASK